MRLGWIADARDVVAKVRAVWVPDTVPGPEGLLQPDRMLAPAVTALTLIRRLERPVPEAAFDAFYRALTEAAAGVRALLDTPDDPVALEMLLDGLEALYAWREPPQSNVRILLN